MASRSASHEATARMGDGPMYQDRTLTCRDCNATFVFTAGEQDFYARKGAQDDPIRCPNCRNASKSARTTEE